DRLKRSRQYWIATTRPDAAPQTIEELPGASCATRMVVASAEFMRTPAMLNGAPKVRSDQALSMGIKGRRIWPRGTKDAACGRHGRRHYCLLLPRSTWVTAGWSGSVSNTSGGQWRPMVLVAA